MLSDLEYVRLSLELNLFFMRIAKEHTIFIQAALGPRDQALIEQAQALRNEFTMLLQETIRLADGVISPEVMTSGELVTKHTLDSERATQFYSAIPIDSELTRSELSLRTCPAPIINSVLVDQVYSLNQRAIHAASILAGYKSRLLQDMLSCKTFTFNYPLLLDHILREAKLYLRMLQQLQVRHVADMKRVIIEQEVFWNQIMAEHAKFIRGFLDPTEVQLFNTAHDFGLEFDKLTQQAQAMSEQTMILPKVSRESYMATIRIRDFKTAGTEGLLQCKIKATAMPLLGDHVIREANHYIRILSTFISRLV